MILQILQRQCPIIQLSDSQVENTRGKAPMPYYKGVTIMYDIPCPWGVSAAIWRRPARCHDIQTIDRSFRDVRRLMRSGPGILPGGAKIASRHLRGPSGIQSPSASTHPPTLPRFDKRRLVHRTKGPTAPTNSRCSCLNLWKRHKGWRVLKEDEDFLCDRATLLQAGCNVTVSYLPVRRSDRSAAITSLHAPF